MGDPATLAAIGWGMSAASWLISPVISRLMNKCFDALGLDPRFQSRKEALDKKLENLTTTLLPQLIILTDAAQRSPHRLQLTDWLQKLKSAFYEAEHLLGLVEYTQLEKKANDLFPPTSKYNFWYDFKFNNIVLNSRKKDLLKSLEKLEKIVDKEASKLIDLLKLPTTNANNSNPRPIENPSEHSNETISGLGGLEVIGRDKDREQIKNLLRKEISGSSHYNAKCFSVIGIWGMGGSGKTTLAQYVCEYEKKNSMYFDLVMWAHVSQNFSVKSIYKKILDSLHEKPEYDSIEGLYSQLKTKLKEQRFLLVLDDAWCDEGVSEQQFQQLFAPLQDAKRGSKILVTTRIENTAKALGATELIDLRQLDQGEFLELFLRHALRDLMDAEKHLEGTLKQIGEQIAAKLHRSPLAATTVAAQLRRRKDPDFWLSMLDENLLNETMGALLLSYQNLRPPLQRCFAFCSLFPKGYEFSPDYLVSLWIGEGFIEAEGSNRHVRDIGNRYILELISSSFLQVKENNWYRLSVHDLLHDLAEKVSEGEYFRIEGGEEREIPIKTRHLYIGANMFEEHVRKICKLKDLRTIIIGRSQEATYLEKKDLNALFKRSKKFYVVDIHSSCIKELPESLFYLENLRYLNWKTNQMVYPKLLNRLYRLRHLRASGIHSPNIGRLTLLQHLPPFYVTNERGRGLEQLEHLTDLYGKLVICGLINVNNSEGARQSKLYDKKGLHELNLHWKNDAFSFANILDDRDSPTRIKDAEVILDELRPPLQLEKLTVDGYSGKRCPIWFSEYNKNTTHLKELELRDCPCLEALPETNNLIHLQSLSIWFLHGLKWWASLPTNLVNLTLYDCGSLAFMSEEELKIRMSTRSGEQSPIDKELEKLVDGDIYKRRYLDRQKKLDSICQVKEVNGELHLPLKLEKLEMGSCFISDKILASSLQGHTSLTHLSLRDIIPITCIPREVLGSLTNLRSLKITNCVMLTSVGGLGTLSSLERLRIGECPCLTIESLDLSNSKSLSSLSLMNCTNLVSLMGLNELTNLRSLEITNCVMLTSVGGLGTLSSLERLRIGECPCLTIESLDLSNSKSLSSLSLMNCTNLVSLMGLNELTNLRSLKITNCVMLTSVGSLGTLSSLERLRIGECPCLTIESLDLSNSKSLSFLSLINCTNLVSLMGLNELTNLRSLEITNCVMLTSVGGLGTLSSLERLRIGECPCLTIESLDLSNSKSLRYLTLKNCTDLVSLMGLNELNNLEYLRVVGCDKLQCSSDASKLPGLRKQLTISKISLLELISRDGLSSLPSLKVSESEQEHFTQEEREMLSNLSSLEEIEFHNYKRKFFPDLSCLPSLTRLLIVGCKHLTSLSELPPSLLSIHIFQCEHLTSLSELPPSLQSINISHCNDEFTRSCEDTNHPNGQKIFRIPKKHINRAWRWNFTNQKNNLGDT